MISTSTQTPSVALLGNPNTGKSTLFNALAGTHQRVGNYPGCTVEKKTGSMTHQGQRYELVDLPGTYSLAPRSPDEMVAVDVLLGRRADARRPSAVLAIVDASNLERNLYLVSQVLELGLPTVLALNMSDVARNRGIAIDAPRLERQLGVPVVELQANKKIGVEQLKEALAAVLAGSAEAAREPSGKPEASARNLQESPFPPAFCQEVSLLQPQLSNQTRTGAAPEADGESVPRYLVERLLLDTSGYLEGLVDYRGTGTLDSQLVAARKRLLDAGYPVPAVEAMARYGWVAKVLDGVVRRPSERKITATDRIDRILTHKWLGTIVFALVMIVVFQSVFSWANTEYLPLMDWIKDGLGLAGKFVEGIMAEGPLRSLLVDGVIAGVGGVLVFLPQILILFFFIGILEDCGYMARTAYLMDKLMSRVGLSGKSFIPLLSSFACAIPGVMATRVIENRRDRLTTILVAPLMSCSARLPVYTLLIYTFIPPTEYLYGWLTLPALVMFGMYLLGIVTAVVVAFVLKKTLLRGETPPFVMELPSYKWPSPRTVLYQMYERGWSFVRRAGTLILALSIVLWGLLYFPHDPAVLDPADVALAATLDAARTRLAAQVESVKTAASPVESVLSPSGEVPLSPEERALAEVEDQWGVVNNRMQGDFIRHSFLGRFGQMIEPLVRPLGWDWRIGSAAIASFPAREVVVATLGIIYNLGGEQDEESADLKGALMKARWDPGSPRAGQPVFTIPVALSITVFFALCAQCAATLVVIKRETNHWGWPIFTFVYMTALAYLAALVTYQAGAWLLG